MTGEKQKSAKAIRGDEPADSEIFELAWSLVEECGEGAASEAARRAMARNELGESQENRTWRRVLKVINEMEQAGAVN